jgi:hypothetical protein
MKKRLPLSQPVPAARQTELAAKPVKAGSKPEFPTRDSLYKKTGLIGGMLASGLAGGAVAHAAPSAKPAPVAMVDSFSPELGTIDGTALPKATPKINVYREGGGIGPAEDMWQIEDVEAFLDWTMAKEGHLAIQRKYKLDVDGTTISLDGFDPTRNIGYAYTDPHDNESSAFTDAAKAKLAAWQKANKISVLLIEVKRYPDPATLKGKVVKFLHATNQAPPATAMLPQPAAPAPIQTKTPAKKGKS